MLPLFSPAIKPLEMLRLKLDNGAVESSFFENTRLIGIVAPVKYYSFTLNVNRNMGFNFRINNQLEINLKRKGRNYFFHVYEFTAASGDIVHYLYHNHHEGESLLPEFKTMDFIWLLKFDVAAEKEISSLINEIKKQPGVQLVTEIPKEKVKNKEHLIL